MLKGNGGKSSLAVLQRRELFGNNHSYDVRTFQRRGPLKVLEYHPTLCSSQVLLGFSSLGNYLWGYSVQTNEAEEACLIIQCWKADFTEQRRFKSYMEITMPHSYRSMGEYEELVMPLICVEFEETALAFMILEEKDQGRYAHHASLTFFDRSHPYAGLTVGTTINSDNVFSLTRHHLYMHEQETVLGLEMGIQILVIHVGPTAPPFKTCRWWRKSTSSLRACPARSGEFPPVSCMSLDTEGFLTDHLPAQLNAKLVRYKERDQLAEGTFCILDMSIALVRFLSTRSFEFVVVAEVRTPKEEFFTAFVAQLTCTGHRIVQSMKAAVRGSTAEDRCYKLREVRQRGFEGGNCVLLTNDALYVGALERLRNPALPYEIRMNMEE